MGDLIETETSSEEVLDDMASVILSRNRHSHEAKAGIHEEKTTKELLQKYNGEGPILIKKLEGPIFLSFPRYTLYLLQFSSFSPSDGKHVSFLRFRYSSAGPTSLLVVIQWFFQTFFRDGPRDGFSGL